MRVIKKDNQCNKMNNNTSIRFHGNILASQSFDPHTCVDLQLSDRNVFVVFKQLYYLLDIILCSSFFLISCSLSKQINQQANTILLKDTVISTGFTGISLYEPATGKYWYNYDATKNFVPASNIKLFSLYAGMKYLGDSLIGLRYLPQDSGIIIYPTGDPSFLHPHFKQQPVFDFLKNKTNISYYTQHFSEALGTGWAWDDYNDNYMVQRSELPIYGNLTRIFYTDGVFSTIPKNIPLHTQKGFEKYGDSVEFSFSRKWESNEIISTVAAEHSAKKIYEIPMVADQNTVNGFLEDTLHQPIHLIDSDAKYSIQNQNRNLHIIYSQPADSLFTPMMHNSDNFFAEQTLLMASNEHLGYMSDEAMIDTLLNTDLKDIPQKPNWVDGSGLSRYNLFSPQAMVYILNKLQTEFGIKRLKAILPTGSTGTFKNYYLRDSGYIYAKNGSLSNLLH